MDRVYYLYDEKKKIIAGAYTDTEAREEASFLDIPCVCLSHRIDSEHVENNTRHRHLSNTRAEWAYSPEGFIDES